MKSMFGLILATTMVADPTLREEFPRKKYTPPNTDEELLLKKGLTKFWYGENYVIALNKKVADKKAKKNKWI